MGIQMMKHSDLEKVNALMKRRGAVINLIKNAESPFPCNIEEAIKYVNRKRAAAALRLLLVDTKAEIDDSLTRLGVGLDGGEQ